MWGIKIPSAFKLRFQVDGLLCVDISSGLLKFGNEKVMTLSIQQYRGELHSRRDLNLLRLCPLYAVISSGSLKFKDDKVMTPSIQRYQGELYSRRDLNWLRLCLPCAVISSG